MDIKGTSGYKPSALPKTSNVKTPATKIEMTSVKSPATQQNQEVKQQQSPAGKGVATEKTGYARSADATHQTGTTARSETLSMAPRDSGPGLLHSNMKTLVSVARTMKEEQLPSNPARSNTIMQHLTEIALPLLGDGLKNLLPKEEKKSSKDNTGASEKEKGSSEGKSSGKETGAATGVKSKGAFSKMEETRKSIKKQFAGDTDVPGGKSALKKDIKSFAELRTRVVTTTGGPPSEAQLRNAIKNAATAIWDILKKAQDDDDEDDLTAGLLGFLMNIHSAFTFEHSNRVMDLTMGLAEELGINNEKQLENLRNAAFFKDIGQYGPDELEYMPKEVKKDTAQYILDIDDSLKKCSNLHDIGKMRIPREIINKQGRLTDEEFDIVKTHPKIGVDIVMPYPHLHGAIPGIRSHHEKWDGKGYPEGLKGKEIPRQARIIAVCDTYDAMTEDRPYRKAMTPDEAARELIRCAGTQFDPVMVPPFLYTLARKGEINIMLYEEDIKNIEEKFGFKSKKPEGIKFSFREKKNE